MRNQVLLCGIGTADTTQGLRTEADALQTFMLSCPRLSGVCDQIPIWFHLPGCAIPSLLGKRLFISGTMRSRYHPAAPSGEKLYLYCWANRIQQTDSEPFNQVILDARVKKNGTPRVTPNGRTIADLLLSVPRVDPAVRDYFPCICWERLAKKMDLFPVGCQVTVQGRFQSRCYQKNEKKFIAREISLQKIIKQIDSTLSNTPKIYI